MADPCKEYKEGKEKLEYLLLERDKLLAELETAARLTRGAPSGTVFNFNTSKVSELVMNLSEIEGHVVSLVYEVNAHAEDCNQPGYIRKTLYP